VRVRAGGARVAITPPAGISLAGFSARSTGARGVHDEVFARALLIEEGNTRLALVVCDLCEIDEALVAKTRGRVRTAAGIAPQDLMIAATHTHAAPATFALFSAPPDPEWLDALPGAIAEAVAGARRDLAPATLSMGVGHEATVGRNRRRADAPTDPSVTVVRFDRDGAAPIHLMHYACHPTVLGPDNLLVSRDYVGFAVDAVERATGGFALFANGACGDINVGHSADRTVLGLPMPGRTFERAEELGLRLATEAVRASAGARAALPAGEGGGGSLVSAQRFVILPLRDARSRDQARAHLLAARRGLEHAQRAGEGDDALAGARLELVYAEMALQWVDHRAQTGTAGETTEIQVFTAGDLALVGLPGEFFAESALRLAARSPYAHTVTIGYANGGIGYVPPPDAFQEGGYETRLSLWSHLAPAAEPIVLEAAAGLLAGLRDRNRPTR